MASLKEIKKRIGSVKNTQKVTKAMQLVAAAKLRRAQHAALSGRAYADAIRDMVNRVSASVGDVSIPLMEQREMKRVDLILLTSDRGLCGGFNENIVRETRSWTAAQRQKGIEPTVIVLGKKGRDALRRSKGENVIEREDPIPESHPFSLAQLIAGEVETRFTMQASSGAVLASNRFLSAGRQQIHFEPLLPFGGIGDSPQSRGQSPHFSPMTLYEPSQHEILNWLVNEALLCQIFQGLLDSKASELAARMMAMDNATKNAGEMMEHLTLVYNRERQAAITADLMDIVGGAEALS